jgi:serine/threonine-protein kinase HipA
MVTERRPRMPPSARELVIWTNGQRVGTWSTAGGDHSFQYDESWPASPAGRRLSISLPFTPGNAPHRGAVVRNFFDNLLPESESIRRRVRDRFGTQGTDAFELLAAIGRDCVGAVQLLPGDARPTGFDLIEGVALDERGVEQAINNALAAPPPGSGADDHEFRVSIAGAQEKTALLRHRNQWWLPRGATPTSHIFKLPIGLVFNIQADMTQSVENEWLCARILRALGFPVAGCEIATFGQRKVLVVERFDRLAQAGPSGTQWLARVPQEDLCQALGVAAAAKYETDGGPGVAAILRQLEAGSRPDEDKLTFITTLLAFWLMAALDGHAKNFSIFLERGGGFRMTPLYDVLSFWPIIGDGPSRVPLRKAKLAMALRSKNTHYHLHEIQTRHWQELARQCGVPDAFDRMVALVLQVPVALEEVSQELPPGFPQKVFAPIRAGMLAQAERFAGAL